MEGQQPQTHFTQRFLFKYNIINTSGILANSDFDITFYDNYKTTLYGTTDSNGYAELEIPIEYLGLSERLSSNCGGSGTEYQHDFVWGQELVEVMCTGSAAPS